MISPIGSRLTLVLATCLLAGCSTMTHYMPPVPMQPGTLSPQHSSCYVTVHGEHEGQIFGYAIPVGNNALVELDLHAILREYERTGVMVLAQDRDVDQRAVERVKPGWKDLTLGLGP